MSVEQALEFLERTQSDGSLQQRVEGCSGRDALTQLTTIAAEVGYSFSPEEYREAVRQSVDGELDQESLDQVLRDVGLDPDDG